MHSLFQKMQKSILFWVLVVIVISSTFLAFSEFGRNHNAKVVFLDVGQGDSILILSPNGRRVLIDSGKYDDISLKLAPYIPFSDHSFDFVIATHPDIDHITGFNTLLNEYHIGTFFHSGLLAGSPVYRSIAQKVQKYHIPAHSLIAGEKIFLDKDMYLEVLSPHTNQKIEDANDYSVVVRLVYQGKAIMLTGDAPQSIERNLVKLYGVKRLESEVLKLGHHGSKTSSADIFVKAVNPKYGIISTGCHNKYGHPHANTLRTLDENNVEEINTCEHGDIIFEFNNGHWEFR